MNEPLLILGMFAVTFGVRYLLFAGAGRLRFPPRLSAALGFVPPAVLTAIIVPAVLIPDGQRIDASLGNPYLLAALAALGVALWRRDLLLTIVFGMSVFMVLKWGLGL